MSYQKKSVALLISALIGTYLPAVFAQAEEPDTVPPCVSVADDADGDGTGVTLHLFTEHACVVTDETTQYPLQVAVDGQLSLYTLQRNHWNPAQDLANREIECTNYTWDGASGSFEVDDVFTITHHPLAGNAPHLGEYEIRVSVNDEIRIGTGLWRSIDGRYVSTDHTTESGKTLKLHADPWGETIRFQNDQSGMRFWNKNSRDPQDSSVIIATSAQECRYTSGDTFEPTGHLEEETTGDIVVSIGGLQTVVLLHSSEPEIINPQTGSLVPLRPLYFKLERDLLQKQMWCTDYTWQDDAFTPVSTKPDGYLFMPPLQGEDRGNLYIDHQQQGALEAYEWWTEDTALHTTSGFVAEAWQEATATTQKDFKLWHPDTNPATYTECVLDDNPAAATPAVELSEIAPIPLAELPEETDTQIGEAPEQTGSPIEEVTNQTAASIDQTTEQSSTESKALHVSTETSMLSGNTPAPTGNINDSIAESAQTASTPVTKANQVSGGGPVSLFMMLFLAGLRRFGSGICVLSSGQHRLTGNVLFLS